MDDKEDKKSEYIAKMWFSWIGQQKGDKPVYSSEDYITASNVMKSIEKGWDGTKEILLHSKDSSLKTVPPYDRDIFSCVLNEWVKAAALVFINADRSENFDSFVESLKEDIIWWNKEQKFVQQDHRESRINMVRPITAIAEIKGFRTDKLELMHKWSKLWVDSCTNFNSKDMVNAVRADDVELLKYIVTKGGVKVNQKLYLENSEHLYYWGFNEFDKPSKNANMRRIGFFARSLKMVEVLTELGFNWNNTDSTELKTKYSLLGKGESDFSSSRDKTGMISFISNLDAEEKRKDTRKFILNYLKVTSSRKDIDIILKDTNWEDLRWDDNRNCLHLMAKTNPLFFRKFANINQKNLLNKPDDNGVLPMDYLLGILDSNRIDDIGSSWIEKITKKNGADWIGAKIQSIIHKSPCPLVKHPDMSQYAERAHYVTISNIPYITWKQGGYGEKAEALKSSRGQEFLKLADENYGLFCNYEADSNLYLNEWCGGNCQFFDIASTEVELKVALWEAWNSVVTAKKNSNYDLLCKLPPYLDKLTKKAIDIGVDVLSMKNEVLSSKRKLYQYTSGSDFQSIIDNHIQSLIEAEARVERKKLLGLVKNHDKNHDNKRCAVLAL